MDVRRLKLAVLVGLAILALMAMGYLGGKAEAHDGCQDYRVTEYSPTGVVGCVVYGTGWASSWGGPGVARNDCVWPWRECQPIRITSLETGRSIDVIPTMYCDCYTGTWREVLVDLGPASLKALGLEPGRKYRVAVEPLSARGVELPPALRQLEGSHSAAPLLPDTALR